MESSVSWREGGASPNSSTPPLFHYVTRIVLWFSGPRSRYKGQNGASPGDTEGGKENTGPVPPEAPEEPPQEGLKGSLTIFLFSVRTHILDSNEVWYSWFWSEGSINALNPKFLDFYFVPRDLESRRHMGPRIAAIRGPCRRNTRSHVALRPKSAIPHLITIQNMSPDRK